METEGNNQQQQNAEATQVSGESTSASAIRRAGKRIDIMPVEAQ